uniref:Uncharacterized protein n=1 Tax=Anguilla anguilla TaxID=7936 RepID=A0A0E9XV03_ANGAN
MTGRLLSTSCSSTSTSELLKFFLRLESGAPPSLDFRLGILDFSLNFSFQFLCVHTALQSDALLWGLAGRLPMLIRNNWHALSVYDDKGIHHYKNMVANNSEV